MLVRAEVTTEPFEGEGELPGHVRAAADAMVASGLEPDLGPLGTAVHGDAEVVTAAIRDAARAALSAGATRVSVQVERIDD
ncbi:thiamine-binding protein [Flexivirga alba]|uniref:Thiamine-binding protein n=1 Tax=Flexivirga alba TaxID=702742 RepID=A0ABW2AJ90_9MICO